MGGHLGEATIPRLQVRLVGRLDEQQDAQRSGPVGEHVLPLRRLRADTNLKGLPGGPNELRDGGRKGRRDLLRIDAAGNRVDGPVQCRIDVMRHLPKWVIVVVAACQRHPGQQHRPIVSGGALPTLADGPLEQDPKPRMARNVTLVVGRRRLVPHEAAAEGPRLVAGVVVDLSDVLFDLVPMDAAQHQREKAKPTAAPRPVRLHGRAGQEVGVLVHLDPLLE